MGSEMCIRDRSILIGNNGSGKSNVLEAISGIFVNAYSAKAIHKFVYSLTYEIKGKEVKLEQTIFYKGIMPSETGFRFSSGL